MTPSNNIYYVLKSWCQPGGGVFFVKSWQMLTRRGEGSIFTKFWLTSFVNHPLHDCSWSYLYWYYLYQNQVSKPVHLKYFFGLVCSKSHSVKLHILLHQLSDRQDHLRTNVLNFWGICFVNKSKVNLMEIWIFITLDELFLTVLYQLVTAEWTTSTFRTLMCLGTCMEVQWGTYKWRYFYLGQLGCIWVNYDIQ